VPDKNIIRWTTISLVVVAFVLPYWMASPKKLPSLALGDGSVLYAERGFALFFVALFVVVVVFRAWDGDLPNSMSDRGVGGADKVIQKSDDSMEKMQGQIDALEKMIDRLSDEVAGE
jgi:hypothetical protein